MPYTSKIQEYTIDLDLQPEDRWLEVIEEDSEQAENIAVEAIQAFKGVPRIAKAIFKEAYKWTGGLYMDEIECWADAIGMPANDWLLLQCSYEFGQLAETIGYKKPKWMPFGCTTGVKDVPGSGMTHFRTLDWELLECGNATRLFNFVKGNHEFTVVGITGLVGALSGMVPGQYSVTINYAPALKLTGFGFGPLFLLREVLETCKTYRSAVTKLKNTALSSNVFFTVCGTKQNEACIIERTRDDCYVRKFKPDGLVQGNHFHSSYFEEQNAPFEQENEDGECVLYGSEEREEGMAKKLKSLKKISSLTQARTVVNTAPVKNDDTYQQMIFCPKKGELKVWRYLTD
ncbi:MAG: hypothetical protein HQK83_11740 [Fibrobacteria bacterium]|nr:hypothetical protein [Fibrobacteria bacterium]